MSGEEAHLRFHRATDAPDAPLSCKEATPEGASLWPFYVLHGAAHPRRGKTLDVKQRKPFGQERAVLPLDGCIY